METKRTLTGPSGWISRFVLVAVAVLGICDILNLPIYAGITYHRSQYLAIILGLTSVHVFLAYPPVKRMADQTAAQWYDWVCIAGAVACNAYIAVTFANISTLMEFVNTERLVMGTIGIVLLLEMVRRSVGMPLVIVVAVFILYAVYSDYFPDVLYARPATWPRAITYLYYDPSGLYGAPLGVMAGVVLAFVLFGNLLFASGGGQFLTDISMRAMGRYRGGPAKMSIFSSSLFGTMTGSAAANVAFTGMITIPLMKRVGYRPAFAGAVEAVASSGGLLAPPVMGAAAFLMADFINIPYSQVALAALGPALLYYISVFIQVHLVAVRDDLPSIELEDVPGFRDNLRGALIFVVPLCVLIYCLFYRFFSPDTSVIYATASLLLVMAVAKLSALAPKELLRVLESTGQSLVQPIVIASLAGLILGVVNLTGLGSTLSQALILMASDNLAVLLVFTAFASIILGMGMPAVAIYILLAVLVAPALEKFGIDPLAAHLFIYYFGIMSYVTPPMAFACFVSGPMAGADPFRTGIEGMKLSVVAYVIPFLFVLYPELLLIGHWTDILIAMTTAIGGAACLAAAVAGFHIRRLSLFERLAFVAAAIALMMSEIYTDLAGMAMIAALILWLVKSKKASLKRAA
jgi:TRAP transporter 4TM/12TM fusion protein